MTEPVLDWIETQKDDNCGLDANYQHLKYLFEGYRAWFLGRECPYSPGSARNVSWLAGNTKALEDEQ